MLETIDHEIIMTWPSTLAVLAICTLGMFGLVTGWLLTKSDSLVGRIFGGAITTLVCSLSSWFSRLVPSLIPNDSC